jgi:PAS domain-containing protein
MPSAERSHVRLLDLENLESDAAPLFVIKTGEIALEFDFVFCNEVFRKLRLRDSILAKERASLLFRCWAQALGEYKPRYEFGGRVWTAEVAGRKGGWKVVRATESDAQQDPASLEAEADDEDDPLNIGRTPVFTKSKAQLINDLKRDRTESLKNIPFTNLHARWESIQTMMEMSDVGVFEYNSEGKLLHANEAWYRLRYLESHYHYFHR